MKTSTKRIAHAYHLVQLKGRCWKEEGYCEHCTFLRWQRANFLKYTKYWKGCSFQGAKRAAKDYLRGIPGDIIFEAVLKEADKVYPKKEQ